MRSLTEPTDIDRRPWILQEWFSAVPKTVVSTAFDDNDVHCWTFALAQFRKGWEFLSLAGFLFLFFFYLHLRLVHAHWRIHCLGVRLGVVFIWCYVLFIWDGSLDLPEKMKGIGDGFNAWGVFYPFLLRD